MDFAAAINAQCSQMLPKGQKEKGMLRQGGWWKLPQGLMFVVPQVSVGWRGPFQTFLSPDLKLKPDKHVLAFFFWGLGEGQGWETQPESQMTESGTDLASQQAGQPAPPSSPDSEPESCLGAPNCRAPWWGLGIAPKALPLGGREAWHAGQGFLSPPPGQRRY